MKMTLNETEIGEAIKVWLNRTIFQDQDDHNILDLAFTKSRGKDGQLEATFTAERVDMKLPVGERLPHEQE